MSASVVILPDTTGMLNAVGSPFRVQSYNNFYTLQVTVNNFTGALYIEASLEKQPTENGWFYIFLNGNIPYFSFPANPNHPTGFLGLSASHGFEDTNSPSPIGDTGNLSFSFQVNALFIRARMDRGFIQPPPTNIYQIQAFGNIEQVILGY
jgi:hypothetical protein